MIAGTCTCPADSKSNINNDVKLESRDVEKSDVIGEDAEDSDDEDKSKLEGSPVCPVSYKELFRMATLGGAKGVHVFIISQL